MCDLYKLSDQGFEFLSEFQAKTAANDAYKKNHMVTADFAPQALILKQTLK